MTYTHIDIIKIELLKYIRTNEISIKRLNLFISKELNSNTIKKYKNTINLHKRLIRTLLKELSKFYNQEYRNKFIGEFNESII